MCFCLENWNFRAGLLNTYPEATAAFGAAGRMAVSELASPDMAPSSAQVPPGSPIKVLTGPEALRRLLEKETSWWAIPRCCFDAGIGYARGA